MSVTLRLNGVGHSMVRVACALLATVLLIGCQVVPAKHSLPPDVKRSIEQYRIDTSEHPSEQFLGFRENWANGDRELASYLYFVGIIRSFTYLVTNPDLAKSGEPALFSSFVYIGRERIDEWVRNTGNPKDIVSVIDQALSWHAQNDDQLTPKAANKDLHEQARKGLLARRTYYEEEQFLR